MFFEKRATEWFDQLDDDVQRDWRILKREFKKFFFSGDFDQSKQAAYYQAAQYRNESPIEFLIRFNSLAKKAKINFRSDRQLAKEHVRIFISNLKDTELADSLPGYLIRDADELYEVLREQKITSSRRKSETRFNNQKKLRFDNEKTDNKTDDKKRVHFTKESKSKRRNVNDSSSPSESEDSNYDNSDSDIDNDENERVLQIEERKYNNNHKRQAEVKRCTTCNSASHDSSNCWKTIKCTACNAIGHPVERCFKICKVCKKIHEEGGCIFAEMGEWLRNNHYEDLPEMFKHHLNL